MSIQKETRRTRSLPFGDFPFDHLFGIRSVPMDPSGGHTPVAQVSESDHGFAITVELPGVREENLQVQVQTDRATIQVAEGASDGESRNRFEGYQRAYRFRTPLNPESASAKLEHGILKIDLPKAASAVPRTLQLSPGA